MTLDRKTFIRRQGLFAKPGPALAPEQIRRWWTRDEVSVQDRLHDVLQAGPLADDLVAPGHLAPECLGAFVGNPDLRQKPAGMKLRQHRCVDFVGLDLGMRDQAHLARVGYDHAADMGA